MHRSDSVLIRGTVDDATPPFTVDLFEIVLNQSTLSMVCVTVAMIMRQ